MRPETSDEAHRNDGVAEELCNLEVDARKLFYDRKLIVFLLYRKTCEGCVDARDKTNEEFNLDD